ncbi:MAG: M50 family metallopeptidase [Planctomycetes bacterium]|nr:M50 family metallopeptidase [Planctomycetota bacterium]
MGAEPGGRGTSRTLLLLAALLVLVAWRFPEGRLALYPFSLLATFAHEMGHGTTALLLGQSFDRLEMHPDGSGVAYWGGDPGRLTRALVAAGGLVGPSVVGAAILVLSRRPARARLLLGAGAALLALAAVLFCRNGFALGFTLGAAAVLAAAASWLPPTAAAFLVQLLGLTLCLSIFLDLSYMFSPGAVVDGQARPSDSQQMADALLLPYWFWGGVTALFSFAVLGAGMREALRGEGTPARS